MGCLGTQGTLEFSEGPRGPRFRSKWDAFQYWGILPGRGRHSAQVFGLKVLFMQQHLRKGLLATPFPAAPP